MSQGMLPPQAGQAAAHLLRGVVYSDRQEKVWQDILSFQPALREYLRVIGLELHLNEPEGFAFLRQCAAPEEDGGGEDGGDEAGSGMPRLIPRRQLSYALSVLCVLLRKKLLEADCTGGSTRVVVDLPQLVEELLLARTAEGLID